tara:strand:- start:143 stop:298 length:156 start_codon:yes stop_codon:yes gene_type:complete
MMEVCHQIAGMLGVDSCHIENVVKMALDGIQDNPESWNQTFQETIRAMKGN